MNAEAWLCPLCAHLNETEPRTPAGEGYCQSDMCINTRLFLLTRGFRPLPEIVQARYRGAEA